MSKVLSFLFAWCVVTCVLLGDASKEEVIAEAQGLSSTTEELASALWDISETAFREHRSAALLIDTLSREGFEIDRGVAGMPTAFIASYGEGKPIIGILAEYDALPGAGNAAQPRHTPRADGVTSGHGCGHNLFGAASVTATIATKRLMQRHDLSGTLRLYGTPAEETGEGKVYLAKAGHFDDLDAALHWHPMFTTETQNQSTLAINNFKVAFSGQSAHGALDPWNGRSALDAVEIMNFAVNMMREHIRPTARIHYVISNGGGAPNVVPDHAEVWYFVRDVDRTGVDEYYARILKIVDASALATETKAKVTLLAGAHPVLLNRPLQDALEVNLQMVGPPEFDEKDQRFARALQEAAGVEPSGFNTAVTPLPDDPGPVWSASTDAAEVSHITPTVAFSVASAPPGVPWHSWATTASHGTSAGIKSAVVASKVLALTTIDLLQDGALRQHAKQAFIDATDGKPYRSPLPVDQQPILPDANGK